MRSRFRSLSRNRFRLARASQTRSTRPRSRIYERTARARVIIRVSNCVIRGKDRQREREKGREARWLLNGRDVSTLLCTDQTRNGTWYSLSWLDLLKITIIAFILPRLPGLCHFSKTARKGGIIKARFAVKNRNCSQKNIYLYIYVLYLSKCYLFQVCQKFIYLKICHKYQIYSRYILNFSKFGISTNDIKLKRKFGLLLM